MAIVCKLPITGALGGTVEPPNGSSFVLVDANNQIYELKGPAGAAIANLGRVPFSMFSAIGISSVNSAAFPSVSHDGSGGATRFAAQVRATTTAPKSVAVSPARETDPSINTLAGSLAMLSRATFMQLESNVVGAQMVVMEYMPGTPDLDVEFAAALLAPSPSAPVSVGSIYYADNLAASNYSTYYPWSGPRAVIERLTLVTNAAVAGGDLTVFVNFNGLPAHTLTLANGAGPGDSVSVVPVADNVIQQGQLINAYQGGADTTPGDSVITFQWRALP